MPVKLTVLSKGEVEIQGKTYLRYETSESGHRYSGKAELKYYLITEDENATGKQIAKSNYYEQRENKLKRILKDGIN